MMTTKRLVVVGFATLLLAVSFWVGSRYPQLNEKALMGDAAFIEPIGFDTLISLKENDPTLKKIAFTTLNWMDTNKKGMIFGLLFAAMALTLLSLLRTKSFKSVFANSVLGALIGAPLGVCTNCAAPIAYSLYKGGLRPETAIAAMVASPTLNVIVLTILLSLFPFYMFAIKIGMTLLFLLVALPLLSATFLRKEFARLDAHPVSGSLPVGAAIPSLPDHTAQPGEETWRDAIIWFPPSFLRNLYYIVKRTVPLMLLAGLLGAIVITLAPWEWVVQMTGSPEMATALAALVALAFFGVFLPVPIAFDVIVTAILIGAGMPVKYAMTLLFTLGVFSVYSFFIIRRAMSLMVAMTLTVTLAGLGVASGLMADYYEQREGTFFAETIFASFAQSTRSIPTSDRPIGNEEKSLVENRLPTPRIFVDAGLAAPPGMAITRTPFIPSKPQPAAAKPFTRVSGEKVGIAIPSSFSAKEYISPFALFRSIASGDWHNDGWPDIAITAGEKVLLFANVGGRFERQPIAIPGLESLRAVSVSLADLNNDGWLDLFITTFGSGNYIVYNQKGRFSGGRLVALPKMSASQVTMAPALGDISGNGELDIVLGNYASIFGVKRGAALVSAQNGILYQSEGRFRLHPLIEYMGDTLVTYIGDYNGDNRPDLIFGNDLQPPDIFYTGTPKGKLRPVMVNDQIVPVSPTATMSIAVADIDNDLREEIYLVGISQSVGLPQRRNDASCDELAGLPYAAECGQIVKATAIIRAAHRKRDPTLCDAIIDETQRNGCIGLTLFWRTMKANDITMCDTYPPDWSDLEHLCRKFFGEHQVVSDSFRESAIPQIFNENVLLVPTGGGAFENHAKERGLSHAGWGWNSQFADLNNDGWLDALVSTGHLFQGAGKRESNYFFLNEGNGSFREASEEYGLVSYRETLAYTYIDFDNDGDLDIVTVPLLGPLWTYRNNGATGKTIIFELRDGEGNRFGLGSKVIIRYGPHTKRRQVRQMEAVGGGFHSQNEPAVHFGVGKITSVTQVEILWRDGKRSLLNGPFHTGWRYRITRQKK